jgi:hypothetical protein
MFSRKSSARDILYILIQLDWMISGFTDKLSYAIPYFLGFHNHTTLRTP